MRHSSPPAITQERCSFKQPKKTYADLQNLLNRWETGLFGLGRHTISLFGFKIGRNKSETSTEQYNACNDLIRGISNINTIISEADIKQLIKIYGTGEERRYVDRQLPKMSTSLFEFINKMVNVPRSVEHRHLNTTVAPAVGKVLVTVITDPKEASRIILRQLNTRPSEIELARQSTGANVNVKF